MRPFLAAYHWNHCWSFIHSCTPTALKHLSRSFLTSPGTGMYKKQGESRPISVQHPAPPANVRPPWGHNAADSMSCLFRACPWAADLVLEQIWILVDQSDRDHGGHQLERIAIEPYFYSSKIFGPDLAPVATSTSNVRRAFLAFPWHIRGKALQDHEIISPRIEACITAALVHCDLRRAQEFLPSLLKISTATSSTYCSEEGLVQVILQSTNTFGARCQSCKRQVQVQVTAIIMS